MDGATTADELALLHLIARLAHAIDDRDEAAYRNCFAPALEQWREGKNDGWEEITAVDYARNSVASVAGLDWTHHQVMSPIVTVDGDRASACTDIVVLAHALGETVTIGGRYALEFARLGGEWRVTRRRRITRYVLGDPTVIARAQQASG